MFIRVENTLLITIFGGIQLLDTCKDLQPKHNYIFVTIF
jgi:hypothetical protein